MQNTIHKTIPPLNYLLEIWLPVRCRAAAAPGKEEKRVSFRVCAPANSENVASYLDCGAVLRLAPEVHIKCTFMTAHSEPGHVPPLSMKHPCVSNVLANNFFQIRPSARRAFGNCRRPIFPSWRGVLNSNTMLRCAGHTNLPNVFQRFRWVLHARPDKQSVCEEWQKTVS